MVSFLIFLIIHAQAELHDTRFVVKQTCQDKAVFLSPVLRYQRSGGYSEVRSG